MKNLYKKNILYILGAGFNRFLRHHSTRLFAPLNHDFFLYLQKRAEKGWSAYDEKSLCLIWFYQKVQLRTGFSKEDLINGKVTLEQLASAIHSRLIDEKSKEVILDLNVLLYFLSGYLGTVFWELEYYQGLDKNQVGLSFARQWIDEQASVITFNYDCILERLIEKIIGVHAGQFWDRAFSYHVQFDRGVIQGRHWGGGFKYKENFLQEINKPPISILKLHGSRNWFMEVPLKCNTDYSEFALRNFRKKRTSVILDNGDLEYAPFPALNFSPEYSRDGWYHRVFSSAIIPPVKEKDLLMEAYPFLQGVWQKAEEKIIEADEIVIIGFSMSGTDGHIREFFKESLSKRSKPPVVTLVNPAESIRENFLDVFKSIERSLGSLEEYLSKSGPANLNALRTEARTISDLFHRRGYFLTLKDY